MHTMQSFKVILKRKSLSIFSRKYKHCSISYLQDINLALQPSQKNLFGCLRLNQAPKYRYRCSSSAATNNILPEQFEFYNENGYLVIKDLFDIESLNSYRNQFVKICNKLVDRGPITIVKEHSLQSKGLKPEEYINKLNDISYDDVFAKYTEYSQLLHILCQFIGDDITAVNSMFINKPAGSDRHPPHQDMYFFPFRPAEKLIATWTAIDHVTIENGALYVVPGSHKTNIIHPHGNIGISKTLYHGVLDEEVLAPLHKRVHLEISPGDTILFHPLIIHGSGPNVSKTHRKSIACHFMDSNCEYINVRGTVQDTLVVEFERELKKLGLNISFEDHWRFKSKKLEWVKSKI